MQNVSKFKRSAISIQYFVEIVKMKVNQDHWTAFLDLAEIHPELITNKFYGVAGRAHSTNLWTKVVHQLNSIGYGTKTIDGWRKAVTDWKSKVKAKAAKLKLEQSQTGGGDQKVPPLSCIEERLLKIIGSKAIEGNNVVELGIPPQMKLSVEEKEEELVRPSSSKSCKASHSIVKDANSLINNISTCERQLDNTPTMITSTPKKMKLDKLQSKQGKLHGELLSLNKESTTILKSIDSTLKKLQEDQNSMVDSLATIAESLQTVVQYFVESDK